MIDNFISVKGNNDNSIELYEHDIFLYADEYINRIYPSDNIKELYDYFPDMILYIRDRINKPSIYDINTLDKLFDIYIHLSSHYRILPTIGLFALLVSIPYQYISEWSNDNLVGITRIGNSSEKIVSSKYIECAKRWNNICKQLVINRLTNKPGTDANLIFIAKSVHGMAETAPIQARDNRQVLAAQELPLLGTVDHDA